MRLVAISRSRSIAGSATLTMLMSTDAMKTANAAAITNHHWLRSPSAGAELLPR
nr:hypothetical protein [Kibdelosporangium sp. MJ126-NF4]CTQ98807.1 hypothetical protein [Kibdelosporangium sp. MJ126-NF4]